MKEFKTKYSCENCGRLCEGRKEKVTGRGRKKILLVLSELTNQDANEIYLNDDLKLFDIDINRDCWLTYAIQCYKDSKTSFKEVNNCRQNLFNTIDKLKPKKIILFGVVALQTFLSHRTSVSSTSQKELWWEKWTKWKIPDQTVKSWAYVTYDPFFVYQNPYIKGLELKYYGFLEEIINHKEDFPDYSYLYNVEIINDLSKAKEFLRRIKDDPFTDFSFDYETTGLKPHATEHKIICVSIAISRKQVFSFPIFDDPEFLRLLKEVLTNQAGKYAHNAKFEETWTRIKLGYHVNNWKADTMLDAHYLDNREGITGLKFQGYMRYGIIGYDDKVNPYLKGIDEKNGNSLNRIEEFIEKFGIEEVLQYCGMDSLIGYNLAKDQEREKILFEEKYEI